MVKAVAKKSTKSSGKKKSRPTPPTRVGVYRRKGKRLFIARAGKSGKPVWKPIAAKKAARSRFLKYYKKKGRGGKKARRADKRKTDKRVYKSARGFMKYRRHVDTRDFRGVDTKRRRRRKLKK